MGKVGKYTVENRVRATDFIVGHDENGNVKRFRGKFFLRDLANDSAYLAMLDDEVEARIAGDALLDDKIDLTKINIEALISGLEGDITTIQGDLMSVNGQIQGLATQFNNELYGVGGIVENYTALVNNTETSLKSYIDQADAALASDYNGKISGLSDAIDLELFVGGHLDIGLLVSRFNSSPSTAQFRGSYINISPSVTFSEGYDPSEKSRVFKFTPPHPPYDIDDLRISSDGDLFVANTKRTAGQAYVDSDWTLALRYIGMYELNNALSGYATKQWVTENFSSGGGVNPEDWFSLIKPDPEDSSTWYVQTNYSLTSVKEIQAWTHEGGLPPSWLGNINMATDIALGGIKAHSNYVNGIRINVDGFLEVDPSYSGGGDVFWGDVLNKPTYFPSTIPLVSGLQDALDDKQDLLFEVVYPTSGDPYIKTSMSIVSEKEIQAWTNTGQLPGTIWDSIPDATTTSKGVVQIGNGINVSNGVISLNQSVITPQTLSLSGNNLTISGGNTVDLGTVLPDLSWENITGKPATATRWPSWSEVTSKPIELEYLDGVTSGIQAQLNSKLNASVFSDMFELVTTANGSYIRAKYGLASDFELTAYADSGQDLPSIFDNMPKASTGSYGVVKIGSNIDVTDGVISVSGSALNPTLGFVNNILSVNASTVDLSSLETDLSDYYNKSAVDGLVDAVQIGGRNLILNSSFVREYDNWGTSGGSGQTIATGASDYPSTSSVKRSAKWTNTAAAGQGIVASTSSAWPLLENGKEYVITCWVKASSASTFSLHVYGDSGDVVDSFKAFSVNTNWQKIVHIITGDGQSNPRVRFFGRNNGVTYWVNCPKVELGNRATDWTPAPEDVDAAIATRALKNGSSTEDFNVRDLIIHGQVNHWLAQQLVVDDARLQVNRKQGGATVDSGLVIFDKDSSTEVSSLVYDVNGIWRAGGQRIYTDAYKPLADNATNLGGYSAASYPRKSENASITGLWSIYRAGADTTLLRFGTERPWQFRQVREGASAGLSLVSEAGSKAFDIRNTQGVRAAEFFVGGTTARVSLVPNGGNVGLGIDNPLEKLHVVGNGLFTGNLTAGGHITVGSTGNVYLRQANTYLFGGGHAGLYAAGEQYWRAEGTNNLFRIYKNTVVEGNITAQGEVTAYSSSDRRLKSNIKPITSALDIIEGLNPVSYNWNKKAIALNSIKDDIRTNYGVVAQEVEKILPDLVHQTNGYKSVDYIQMIGILLAGVRELNCRINNLERCR